MRNIWAKRRSRGRPGGPRCHPGAGQGLAAPGWGLATWQPPSGLLLAPGVFWYIRDFGFCLVQFREYFICNFSEIQKQELALWLLVNRLVPENSKYYTKMHIKHVGIETKQAWSIKNYRYVCN